MKREMSITFTVAGDSEAKLDALTALQTDIIEIGIPFSDPVAESPEVQRANLRALGSGARDGAVEAALLIAAELRGKGSKTVLYSYYNPVFRFGLDSFFERCADAGAYGVTITDLPFEERNEAEAIACAHGIMLLSTIATVDPARARLIAKPAVGYLRIEPVGSRDEYDNVLASVLEASEIPYALCQLTPEA